MAGGVFSCRSRFKRFTHSSLSSAFNLPLRPTGSSSTTLLANDIPPDAHGHPRPKSSVCAPSPQCFPTLPARAPRCRIVLSGVGSCGVAVGFSFPQADSSPKRGVAILSQIVVANFPRAPRHAPAQQSLDYCTDGRKHGTSRHHPFGQHNGQHNMYLGHQSPHRKL